MGSSARSLPSTVAPRASPRRPDRPLAGCLPASLLPASLLPASLLRARVLCASVLGASVLCGATGAAASVDYRVRLQAATEVDSNAERKEGSERRTDGDVRFLARGSLAWRPTEAQTLALRADVGAKVFFSANDEDLFVSAGSLAYSYSPLPWLSVSVDGAVKDRRERGSATDYLQGGGGGSLRFTLAAWADLRLRAGYGRFLFRPDDASFGYQGDDYALELAFFPARRMRLVASYAYARRGYEAPVFVADGTAGTVSTGAARRDDEVHGAELRWRWLRTVLMEVAYSFQWVRSNSYGFSFTRHRVTTQLSARLPLRLYLHVAGALQLLSFRDPIFVDPVLFIEDDNRNWVSAKLSRALWRGLSVEARYSFFASGLSGEPLYYRRHVASFGLSYALGR